MTILAGLVALIGVVATLLWRINMAADATRGAAEAVGDASGAVRRFFWRRKNNRTPIEAIEDPREAAAAMMAALAEYDGALTEKEEVVILAQMQGHFGADDKLGRELLAHGRWLAKDVRDLDQFLRRAARPVEQKCTMEEKRDLIEMLRATVAANTSKTDVPSVAVARLADTLLRKI